MDPSKVQGKMREQMTREIKVRLDSERKWNQIAQPDNNKFYSQSYLNKKVAEKLEEEDEKRRLLMSDAEATHEKDPGGESYFMSPKMSESMNLCRCGRRKENIHLIKCLQKSVIKYSDGHVSTGSSPIGNTEEKPHIPLTSNGICGFYQSKYISLERSTFYITPRSHLKHKITDKMYNSIIIG